MIAFFISDLYSRFGVKKIVFFNSFDLINFLIVFNCETELTPLLITFFGRFSVLFVNDKKITSLISFKYFRFLKKIGPIIIFIPKFFNSIADCKVLFGSEPESLG